MAQISDGSTDMNTLKHRMFAKLLMFLTLAIGGLVGYFAGFEMGQENALMLVEKGRLAEQTTAETSAAAATTTTTAAADSAALSDEVVACYKSTLGEARYAKIADNSDQLTVDEVFKLLPCTSLEEEETSTTNE